MTDMLDRACSVGYHVWMSTVLTSCVQNLVVEDRIESDHMTVELHRKVYSDTDLHECNLTQAIKEAELA